MNARLRLVVCSFADARRLVAGWHQRHPDCGHGYGRLSVAEARRVEARRIEWRYLDEAAS